MRREVSQRWVLSFADLSLLLLSFFVLLQAQTANKDRVAAGIRAAFGGKGEARPRDAFAAAPLFEGGEAILTASARAHYMRMGAQAARNKTPMIVASQGRDGGSARLDAWEMSAARTTAVARALRAGGLPDAMIEVSIPPMRADDPIKGQTISVRVQPKQSPTRSSSG